MVELYGWLTVRVNEEKMLNNEIEGDQKHSIMKAFIENFIILPFNGLMWNNFKHSTTCFAIEELSSLPIPNQNLFFYLERQKKLYKTSLQSIIELIYGLEPWEEIDADIFDGSMSWVVAVTHEDNMLLMAAGDGKTGTHGMKQTHKNGSSVL